MKPTNSYNVGRRGYKKSFINLGKERTETVLKHFLCFI